jgi:hypothetical protein
MAGADETPNDRAGYIVRTRYDLRTSNLLLLLSGTVSLPRYTFVTSFHHIARPGPRLLLSGKDLLVMRGAAAN